jgi:hypothetical protein
MPKTQPIEKHIAEEILKTGYPLEVTVSDILETDWIVINNETYLDVDENKTREIDVTAVHLSEVHQFTPVSRRRHGALYVGTRLAVECKKSDTHAWVFFTRPEPLSIEIGDGQTLDFLKFISRGNKGFLDGLRLPSLHYQKMRRVARTYAEVKFEGHSSGKSEIFEASNQLMKYAAYEIEGVGKRVSPRSSNPDIHFHFLAIVFDGRLYEAIVEGGKLRLARREHILLNSRRHLKTGEYQEYMIDVVTAKGFPHYLKDLNNDIKRTRLFFSANKDKLEKKAEQFMELIG